MWRCCPLLRREAADAAEIRSLGSFAVPSPATGQDHGPGVLPLPQELHQQGFGCMQALSVLGQAGRRFLHLSLTKIAKFDLAYSSIRFLEMRLDVIPGLSLSPM